MSVRRRFGYALWSSLPIRETADGIVYHRHGVPLVALGQRDDDAVILLWNDLWSLSVADRWPAVTLTWGGRIELDPRRSLTTDLHAFAEHVAALVAHVEAHAPSKIRTRGWLDVPEVRWELVSAMPELPRADRLGQGAFRSAPHPVEDRAVAIRDAPDALEAMLDWLASTPDRPWRDHPREVRIGAEHVYARRRDGSVHRLPLSSLRARHGGESEDAVYVFGRSTALVLPVRAAPCPVRDHLDALLAVPPSVSSP